MVSLDEWCFEFQVAAAAPIARQAVNDLMDATVEWAEARRLGIGGGYEPASPEVGAAAVRWRFRFGLCIQEDGQLIPEAQAGELRDLLQGWCESHALAFTGGFRAFTQEERNPDEE